MFKSLAWPGPTALVLVLIAGIWAVTAGLVEFFAALQAGEPAGTRAMLILGGLATIASGVVACARPSIGTVTGLPGPDPGLDLPGRVVLVPADRGGLRAA